MKQKIHIFFVCLAAAAALADRAAAGDNPYLVEVWNTDDRLPENSVVAITQTHDGYLWLGTLYGLARFDGNSFTRFNVNNTPGLPSNRIVFLFEDSRQTLWVGTETAGLCAVKNGVMQSYPDTGTGGIITGALEEGGNIWFCGANGKYFCWQDGKMDLQPNVPARIAQQLFSQSVHLLVPGKGGVTWELQDGAVKKIRAGKLEKDYGASPWQSSFVYAMRQTPGGQPAVVKFDANVTATCEDAAGNLVVGTKNEGLFWFQPDGSCCHLTKDDGLSLNFVLSLSLDREGNLWVGTDGGGLDRIKRKVFYAPAGLSTEVAQSVAQDAAGGLWVAFNSHGVSYWLTNAATGYGIGASSNAWTVLVDRHQQIWAGTRGEGLFYFLNGNFKPVQPAQKLGREIFVLFEDQAGKIWAGGDNGLGSFDGTNWDFFSPRDGLPASPVRALAEDGQRNLWIGTDRDGLFQLRAGKISPAAAPVKDISCLLASRDGVLWAGTSGHGLAWFQNGVWTNCSTLHGGLTSDSINYLVDDDAGNLWIGSYEGVMRVEKKSLADFAAGAVKTVSCRTFLTRECSAGAQPAALHASDGKLFFPTITGLVAVNPADLKPNTNPPPVVIESVLVDGVEQKTSALSAGWNSVITLRPENEQLEIHFASLNFSAPKNAAAGARFKYRLEDRKAGRQKNWTEIGGERIARFPKLPAGKYIFHVIACNEDGFWNETGATLAVTVEPPFWRKPSFIAVSAVVLLGALAGIVYLISTAKLKRQLRAHRQKELLEKERARIARDLHDQLGANLTQVALLGELAEADKHLPGEVELHAQQISLTARDTTRSLDEIVWALNSSNDTLESLANYACKYAQDYFALAGVSYRAELPTQLPAVAILPEVRHNIFLAFKEAVNNVVKHAQATEARVKLQLAPDKFILSVEDNGRGFSGAAEKTLRNGLKNMRRRLADVQGEFEIKPGAKGGTVVRFAVPLARK